MSRLKTWSLIDIMEVSIDKIIVADAFASGKTKKQIQNTSQDINLISEIKPLFIVVPQ